KYNDFSQPFESTDPLGHKTFFDYDPETGLPTRIRGHVGSMGSVATLATFTSSEHGMPLTATDAEGKTTYFTYDAFGNLTSKLDRLGRLTKYTYDGIGRRTSTTTPRGGVTNVLYNDAGPVFRVDDALGYGHRPFYDLNDNVVAMTDF